MSVSDLIDRTQTRSTKGGLLLFLYSPSEKSERGRKERRKREDYSISLLFSYSFPLVTPKAVRIF